MIILFCVCVCVYMFVYYARPRRVALRVIIREYLYKSLWQLSRPVLIQYYAHIRPVIISYSIH